MPHYQILLFGCSCPLQGQSEHDALDRTETIWTWIEQLAERRIILDWLTGKVLFASLTGEQSALDDVLGVVIACSHVDVRRYAAPVAPLFDLLPRDVGLQTLADLCLPLTEDMQRAMLRWEIARLTAHTIGFNLPAGQLFVVEGWDEV